MTKKQAIIGDSILAILLIVLAILGFTKYPFLLFIVGGFIIVEVILAIIYFYKKSRISQV